MDAPAATHQLLEAAGNPLGICGEELRTCTTAIAAGANVNAFDDEGLTALHHAARNNGTANAALVKLLLSAGADPSAKCENKPQACSPLAVLVAHFHEDAAAASVMGNLLLRAGASLACCRGQDNIRVCMTEAVGAHPSLIACHEWVERCGPDDPEPEIRSTPTMEYEAWMDFEFHLDHISRGTECLYGLLALRQLHVRSRASSTTGTDPHLPSLFRLPDELVNHVLTFWMSPRKEEGGLRF